MGRTLGFVLVLCLPAAGCSIVLAPSHHQGGPHDGGAADGGGVDAHQAPDGGSRPDAAPRDAAMDATPRDAAMDAGPTGDASSNPDATSPDAAMDAGPSGDAGAPDGGMDAAPPGDAGPDAGPCGTSDECVPMPSGWNGPVLLITASADAGVPSCPSTAPGTAFTAYSGLTAPDATCGCSCTPPSPAGTCGSATVQNRSTMCIYPTGTTNAGTIPNDGCALTTLDPGAAHWDVISPTYTPPSGSCTPAPLTTVAPVSWSTAYRGCMLPTSTACGSGSVCELPPTGGDQLCVWIDGDAMCPTGYGTMIVTTQHSDPSMDVMDTRGCTTCSCGGVTGTCSGYVDITRDTVNGCTDTFGNVEVTHLTGCNAAQSLPPSYSFYASPYYTPTASCPPSAVTPMGSATLTGQRTICCAP